MILQTRTYKVDDLDGVTEEGVATIQFALDKETFEIDLSPANAQRLRDKVQRFVDAATPVKTKPAPARHGAKPAAAKRNREHTQDIRAWAKQAGLAVNKRGRISASVIEQYNSAR